MSLASTTYEISTGARFVSVSSTSSIAFSTFSIPCPYAVSYPSPLASSVALFARIFRISTGNKVLLLSVAASSMSATAPVTSGAARDVPLSYTQYVTLPSIVVGFDVVITFPPGADINTLSFCLENGDMSLYPYLSSTYPYNLFTEPTPITPGYVAG